MSFKNFRYFSESWQKDGIKDRRRKVNKRNGKGVSFVVLFKLGKRYFYFF